MAKYPQLADWKKIGESWEKINGKDGDKKIPAGYDLFALKLTNKCISGDKPKFFLSCSIHARELAPAELCTRFAEMLVQGYGNDAEITAVLDHHEVHLVLQGNPDGRKEAEAGRTWRKNKNNNYCPDDVTFGLKGRDRGADLNRNFPFLWGEASTDPCSSKYRGDSALSEPEAEASFNYFQQLFPINQRGSEDITAAAPRNATGVAFDVHSQGELILYPWRHVS